MCRTIIRVSLYAMGFGQIMVSFQIFTYIKKRFCRSAFTIGPPPTQCFWLYSAIWTWEFYIISTITLLKTRICTMGFFSKEKQVFIGGGQIVNSCLTYIRWRTKIQSYTPLILSKLNRSSDKESQVL